MIKPRGPLTWVETERTPPALGWAMILAAILAVLLAFVVVLE
jgi:hypothetical protein